MSVDLPEIEQPQNGEFTRGPRIDVRVRGPAAANGRLLPETKEPPIPDEHPSVVISVDGTATATAVVRVHGELDYSTSDRLSEAIEGTQSVAPRPVVIDFSECRYIDSTVLTVLIRANKTLGDALRVVIPRDSHLRRIFTITNLDRVMQIDETL